MRVIELFAGVAGFRYGLEQASDDYKIVWANEIDRYACQIYRRNYGTRNSELATQDTISQERQENVRDAGQGHNETSRSMRYIGQSSKVGYDERSKLYEGDITRVKAEEIPDHDLLVGGFPCQAFSIAGKRGGFEDTRGTLFFEIARIAQEKRPRLILLENVKGLLSHDKGRTFGAILTTLDEIGYDCQWQVLNSKNFGVPQNRERVFIIGHLRGTSRPEVFPITGANEQALKELTTGQSQGMRVYDDKGISTSIASQAGGWGSKTGLYSLTQQGIIRRLTPVEAERLQGFPDGWTEGVSDTQRYKCLGNAVTTNVIAEIGRRLT